MTTPVSASPALGRPSWIADVLENVDQLSLRVVTRIRAELEVYDALAPAQLDEVRTIAAWCVTRVLGSWETGAQLSPSDLDLLNGIGAARALDGRPLVQVLRAYRIAGHEVTDAVVESAGSALSPAEAIALARLWMTALDQITDALVLGHQEANRHLDGSAAHGVELLVRDLFLGRNVAPAAIRARTERLGLTLPHQVGLLCTRLDRPGGAGSSELIGPETLTALDVELASRDGRSTASPLLAAAWTDEAGTTIVHPALGSAADAERWIATHTARLPARPAVRWGFATVAPSELRTARNTLRAALPLAPTHAWEGRCALTLGDAHVLLVGTGSGLGSPDHVASLVPAAVADDPVLLDTLDAYLATANANEAARRLGCHPQSVRQRLQRLKAATGRDLHASWDRYVLESARLNARR